MTWNTAMPVPVVEVGESSWYGEDVAMGWVDSGSIKALKIYLEFVRIYLGVCANAVIYHKSCILTKLQFERKNIGNLTCLSI